MFLGFSNQPPKCLRFPVQVGLLYSTISGSNKSLTRVGVSECVKFGVTHSLKRQEKSVNGRVENGFMSGLQTTSNSNDVLPLRSVPRTGYVGHCGNPRLKGGRKMSTSVS
jgi:hypothetical protein